ncbi:MAG: hypothetical protein Q8N39_01155 [Pelolinea sp.]|nr:hypothetical protein [Pelolinea sp.]
MNHQGNKPLAIIEIQCSFFRTLLINALEKAGLWVLQSFDLKSSRALQEDCSCVNHGTSQCTCELVVLLVYPKVGNPVTLVLDGKEGMTFIFITDETENQYPTPLIKIIEGAIQKVSFNNKCLNTLLNAK